MKDNHSTPQSYKGQSKDTEKKSINPDFSDLKNPLETHQIFLDNFEQAKKEAGQNIGLFRMQTANEWQEQAKNTPTPLMLFGELWFEGEVCILFSDSNLGKSILSVQIANSISRGEQIPMLKLEAEKQTVLYFDFELSAKQFETRYSEKNEELKIFENHYSFDDNFKRIEINPEADTPEELSFEDYLNESLEETIIKTKAKILIIDNITYLGNETEKSKGALPLMKHLQSLKRKYNLSILVLAHTPKRDLSRPITQNDLAGSKMLYNFADSCFAIGKSSADDHLRYIIQLKERSTPKIYGTENIIVCQINKEVNFLAFEFLEYGSEREHLKQISETDKDGIIKQAKELSQSGKTQRDIAKELNISLGAVNKYLRK